MTEKKVNTMTRKGLYGARKLNQTQRWGQAIVNNFGVIGDLADKLFYETDEAKVEKLVEQMCLDYNL
jgi:hypothetical protein